MKASQITPQLSPSSPEQLCAHEKALACHNMHLPCSQSGVVTVARVYIIKRKTSNEVRNFDTFKRNLCFVVRLRAPETPLWEHFLSRPLAMHSMHVLYMHTVHANCTCILYMHTVHAYCACTVCMYSMHVQYACTVCMYSMQCMYSMHVQFACTVCMYSMHVQYACTVHDVCAVHVQCASSTQVRKTRKYTTGSNRVHARRAT